MRKVLFLDFDGVLHPAQGSAMPEFHLVGCLADVLRGTACEVVISSTWRDHHPLPHLRRLLGDSLGPRVVDVLGPDGRGPFVRERAVEAWLASRGEVVDWRALDDTASEFSPGCERLILCNGQLGLQARECELLRQWLGELERDGGTGQ